jgi:hypothetical protein
MPKYGKRSDLANAYFKILLNFPESMPLRAAFYGYWTKVSVGERKRGGCRSPGGFRHVGTDGV